MNVDICTTQNKYSIIYADPPWEFSRWSNKAQRHVTGHYSTMTIQEIMDLPVKEIAAENAVLLMWATFPNLPLALKAIEAWGFTYKTCAFTWVKQNKKSESLFWGMGYYTRSNAEICLLATRGKPLPRLSHKVHSVIVSPVERHSKKPASTRERIVELFGNIPRIELFAREQIEGWDCWGNEVPPPKKRKAEWSVLILSSDWEQLSPNSILNTHLEFIADPHHRINSYFILANCNTEEDVIAKLLEWLSREAYKSQHFNSDARNKQVHKYHRDGINRFCGTDFSHDDMRIIYTHLGNRCNSHL